MKIFDIPPLIDAIQQEIAAGETPDPAKVNLLVLEGPQAVEAWIDCIEEAKAEAAFIKDRIAQLRERMQARLDTVDRMSEALATVLDDAFSGKVKTATVTVWNQDSHSYDFDVPTTEEKYWVTPPKQVDKKALLADLREGRLPDSIQVKQSTSRSIRIRR